MTFARAADRLARPADAARREAGMMSRVQRSQIALVNAGASSRYQAAAKISAPIGLQPGYNLFVRR
jgi:hypothetical protein